ncbi:uncharacterized protein LOC135924917 [Gordionus sp. m RMFG-2023]|uniref:uncharacterized protein LOC135924917 n=1 Tax=Gordionus sp. m RMFG-2023 TaxID=3053472 RepID=UPI0031FBCD1F
MKEKARKRQALCRIKKRNEQSLIPTTSNHLEDTGNKQFASTSNHLEDTENQEEISRIILPKCAIQQNLNLPKSIKTNKILRIILPKCTIQQNLNLPKSIENETLPKSTIHQNLNLPKSIKTNQINISAQQSLVQEHYCGLLNTKCDYCDSLNFLLEKPTDGKFKNCCHKGKVKIPSIRYIPFLQDLLSNPNNEFHSNFMKYIRSYNSSLAFASMGAQISNSLNPGPYCFRVHGQIYHRTSHLYPSTGMPPKFAQLYVLETTQAVNGSLHMKENSGCNEDLLKRLDILIRQNNPFSISFKTLGEIEKEEKNRAIQENRPVQKINMIFRADRSSDKRRYNIPNIDEVAIIFTNDDGEPPFIKVYPRVDGSDLININILSPNLDPMVYPLLFPFGDPGWKPDLKGEDTGRTRANISLLQFKIFRLAIRENEFNPILFAGKLSQQYIVDSYLQVEANNLNFIRQNQPKLRVDEYSGLMDYLETKSNNIIPGKAVILPSSFPQRNMRERYHDAMAIVLKFGKPDLFITFTCNPNWREIKENLFSGQSPTDRPDLIARVFKLKLNELFKIETSQAIDKFVCAEMPDKILDPKLFQIVTHFMIHVPCGIFNPKSPCMENGICTKKFPKDFQMETRPNIDGYPYYKRRDNGITILSGKLTDNRYGYDCTNVDINVASNINIHDEIKSHLNARYVSACESMWRLLENNMHDRSHAVIRLGIHLPLQQPVYFTAGHERDALLRSENNHTTLTAWFELNKTDLNARQYLYGEIPYHYVFTNYHWKLRKKRLNVISRMYSVHPNSGERFFLRLLLLHVCGATSFDYLKTINGILMSTFKEAAIKRNLLSDDKEWESCLEEGSIYQMPSQLRSTFAFICIFCQPENPAYLWNRFRFMMIEDYLRQYSEVIAINMALMDIENVFLDHGLCCQSFDLPSPTKIPPKQHYDAHVEAADSIERISKLNRLQKYAFDLIIQAIELENIPEIYFFVDGPGGSGKTYLYNTLMCYIRAKNQIVLPFATTGISSILLNGGRTIHCGFKLPVPIFETSTSHMNLHSSLTLDIKNSKLIIIDEATMMTKHALRCID